MILDAMLQRLYASLIKGPSLNARPHNSRQRVDLTEIAAFQSLSAMGFVDDLLSADRSVDCPAKVSRFEAPSKPEREWTADQKRAHREHTNQARLLNKFHDIAVDARDYFNDHGEDALFVGYPLLSVPAVQDSSLPNSPRILAPVAFLPVSLNVKRGTRKGIQVKATGEGADLLLPNPALLTWVEQQTGKEIEDLFGDEEGEDPWKELREILGLVTSAMGIRDSFIAPRLPIEPIPKVADLPSVPAVLPCAILGLFPTTNPGLMRDTKWMMSREPELSEPVSLFLNRSVLEVPQPSSDELANDSGMSKAVERPRQTGHEFESLVTQADPCQAEAVSHARVDQAVVIHGPPGTGKSQTIANIIGDHLAHEKRVLFVCDKRTALDVVKYRLDALGLGELCGVIHDVQRDRRDLYLGIRERLEQLPDEERPKSPIRRIQNLNEKLNGLQDELRRYYDTLHASAEERRSFHELVGNWMTLRVVTTDSPPELLQDLLCGDELSENMIDDSLADIDECLQHAVNAELGGNPFYGRLKISLAQFLSGHTSELGRLLPEIREMASELDGFLPEQPLRFASVDSLETQKGELSSLIEATERAANAWNESVSPVVVQLDEDRSGEAWSECRKLEAEIDRLRHSGERNLELVCPFGSVALDELNIRIQALEIYLPVASSWTRVFAFGKRTAAQNIVAPFGVTFDGEGVSTVLNHLKRVKAAVLIVDFLRRSLDVSADQLTSLEPSALADCCESFEATVLLRQEVWKSSFADQISERLAEGMRSAEAASGMLEWMRRSLQRVENIVDYRSRLERMDLFHEAALRALTEDLLKGETAYPLADAWIRQQDSLEDVLRFERRANELSAGLMEAVIRVGKAEVKPGLGVKLLRRAATERELKSRLGEDSSLADITSERVEAALKEFGQRLGQKEGLIRELALYLWRGRQHDRLLASNGNRLSSLGASLRQRLYIRGKRALKLRQMVQAGQEIKEGDPLFDLCPVWMASPSTVAQIFPREPLFDVVIFDEASQCRLEEALPVLLRGKRVVIAGDPKQLPPTRFFESAVGDSEFADAESLEELQEQQMSETEDLLTAALNLDLQSCYLDVHYRSQDEALIGFSNEAFYQSRLQPIPGHPHKLSHESPLRVCRVDGTYKDRSNPDEAEAVADLVEELLSKKKVPSIGIACFNLTQRDLIIRALDKRAAQNPAFATALETERSRQGKGSFEGLFVKNLENVQGDERDHIIISTTFGPAPDGKFRRLFGALSRQGGERRLNVLVTRAREVIHVFTSIPREEYLGDIETEEIVNLTGRHYLYQFLRFAETVHSSYQVRETSQLTLLPEDVVDNAPDATSSVALLASRLANEGALRTTSLWGNEGFCVDVMMQEPNADQPVSCGVLLDFNRYRRTPDPIKWEHFRSAILKNQGWDLKRVWSPELFRKEGEVVENLIRAHRQRFPARTD